MAVTENVPAPPQVFVRLCGCDVIDGMAAAPVTASIATHIKSTNAHHTRFFNRAALRIIVIGNVF